MSAVFDSLQPRPVYEELGDLPTKDELELSLTCLTTSSQSIWHHGSQNCMVHLCSSKVFTVLLFVPALGLAGSRVPSVW